MPCAADALRRELLECERCREREQLHPAAAHGLIARVLQRDDLAVAHEREKLPIIERERFVVGFAFLPGALEGRAKMYHRFAAGHE